MGREGWPWPSVTRSSATRRRPGASTPPPRWPARPTWRVGERRLATRTNRRDRREAIRLLEGLIDEGVDQPQDRLLLVQLYEADNEWPRAHRQLILLRKMPGGNSSATLIAYVSAMLRHGELEEAE